MMAGFAFIPSMATAAADRGPMSSTETRGWAAAGGSERQPKRLFHPPLAIGESAGYCQFQRP
jgi:hypothetical protein